MISVIVPAYNAEKTIRQCVKSIQAQTYDDWELILVDDGSKDGTLVVCQSFDDSRITVLHQPNGGVSSARNKGLDFAKGEYVAFVDADDYIDSGYLEMLSRGLDKDLVITGFCYDNQPENSSFQLSLSNKEEIGAQISTLINADQLCYPWGRLFKRSIIEQYHIRFDENMRFAEDNIFNWEYLCHAESLYIDTTHKVYHKSSDESGQGYNLSFEEMDYIDGRLFDLSKKLEQIYKIQLKLDNKQLMHVLFLKDMLQMTATQWLGYYKKYHPKGTEKEGYDFVMQTVYYMSLVDLARTELWREKKEKLDRLCYFLNSPMKLILSSKLKTRFLLPFIKLRLYKMSSWFVDKLMK